MTTSIDPALCGSEIYLQNEPDGSQLVTAPALAMMIKSAAATARALGNRRSVGDAVEHAVATLAAKQLLDQQLPRCRTRDGVDANQVVVVAPV